MDKKEKLRKAVIKFDTSNRSFNDYMEFLMVVHVVMKQGSGLAWSGVENILDNTLSLLDNDKSFKKLMNDCSDENKNP